MPEVNYTTTIMETDDEWEAIKKIRRKVFMEEEKGTYEQCFDGNDFAGAIHLIAKRDNIVVGGMRVRILSMADGGTVTWDRMAIAPDQRGSLRLLNKLADLATLVTTSKGFRRAMCTVHDRRLIRFWERRGFRLTGEAPEIYADKEYYPMHRLAPAPVPPRISTPESVLNQSSMIRRLSESG